MQIRTALTLAILASVFFVPASAGSGQPILDGHQKLLVLPIGFDYFKQGFTEHDTLQEKTEASRKNLEASAGRAFRRTKELQTVPMPALSAEEATTLAEHLTLLKQNIASVSNEMLITRQISWRDWQHGRTDYSIGPGLAFLAERSGTDAAVYIWGSRLMPTPGLALVEAAGAAAGMYSGVGFVPGSERNMSAVVFDLRTGDIIDMFGVPRGLAGEPYEVPGANTWMHAIFDQFPSSPIDPPQKKAPKPRKQEQYDSHIGFSVMPPQDWRVMASLLKGPATIYRHGAGLERIRVDRIDLAAAKPADGADPAVVAGERARQFVIDGGYPGPRVVRSEAATVAGEPGFEVELASDQKFITETLRFRHLVHGFAAGGHVYLFEYDAPALYYFDRYLPDATASLATFRLRATDTRGKQAN